MNKNFFEEEIQKSQFEEMLENMMIDLKNMPVSVKDAAYKKAAGILEEEMKLIRDCDTPIEYLLATELQKQIEELMENHDLYHEIIPQSTIWIEDKRYRADLLINTLPFFGSAKYTSIIIECDGHEYHEKTKEQAIADKTRDRDLQMEGYRIIRFSGSEIYQNPKKCAADVIRFIKRVIYEE
ncbi:endonuclease domain-containing protein [Niallia sp. FSL W8-1348]|uniref:endonuclease domain-containing protein n=1 Tax=Niallia sp. FSL W8-1348 TaxID=2954656 RepID=UPI0030F681E2